MAWQDARFTAGVRDAIAVYRSRDGATWAETRVGSTSFDICQAPLTGSGVFLADYHQGLLTAGTAVLPMTAAEGDALRRAHSAAVSQALERRLPGWQARAAALAKGRADHQSR